MDQLQPLIDAIAAAAAGSAEARSAVEGLFAQLGSSGFMIEQPIRRIWAGERDRDSLTSGLDDTDRAIIEAVLDRLEGRTQPSVGSSAAGNGGAPEAGSAAEAVQKFQPLIDAIAAVARGQAGAEVRTQIEGMFDTLTQNGWDIVNAIRSIWDGERDAQALTAGKDPNSSAIIRAILAAVAGQPSSVGSQTDARIAEALEKFKPLIDAIVAIARGEADDEAKAQVEDVFTTLTQNGWMIAEPVRRIWSGERDAAALTSGLDAVDTALIEAVLAGVEGRAYAAPSTAEPSDPIARVRSQWKDTIDKVLKARRGDMNALREVTALIQRLSAQDDWKQLSGVLRKIMAGQKGLDLLDGLDATDTVVVGDILRGLGVSGVPEPQVGVGAEGGGSGITLDQLLELVGQAAQPGAPSELRASLKQVAGQMANDQSIPPEVRKFGAVLLAIMNGDRQPDLAGLPDEIAAKIRQMLASLG